MSEEGRNRRSAPWPPVEVEQPETPPNIPEPGAKIPMHYVECFGCGEIDGGLHMVSTMGVGKVLLSQFTVTEAHQGAPGLAHGGILAAAFDEALGAAVGHLLQRPAVTGKLETDFVRPVPVGSTLMITARVDGIAGRKLYASAEGRLDAEGGPVAVRARALFIEVGFEHFTRHDPDALSKFHQVQDQINP